MPEATWIPGIPEFEASVSADLVRVATRDGVGLTGMSRKPKEEGASRLGVDVVLLMHGTGGNFYTNSMMWQYSGALLEQGCAVLRVNNRGHDLVSVSGGIVSPLGAGRAAANRGWFRADYRRSADRRTSRCPEPDRSRARCGWTAAAARWTCRVACSRAARSRCPYSPMSLLAVAVVCRPASRSGGKARPVSSMNVR